jgi:hypothetical protein
MDTATLRWFSRSLRKHVNRQFPLKPADLRLPQQNLEARRSTTTNRSKLDEAVGAMNENRPEQASKVLTEIVTPGKPAQPK